MRANQQKSNIDIGSINLKLELTMTTLLDLISRNSSVLTLHVSSKMVEKRFTSEHRFIVDLCLVGYRFTSDQVITIIRQLNSLKEICVLLKNRLECDRLMSQIGNEWENEDMSPFHFHNTVSVVSLKRR